MKYTAIGENHLYNKVYAKGRRQIGRLVAVYVLSDKHSNRLAKANPQKRKINRIGLTVSKKIGGAVVRNRCKRIIREAYRQIDKEKGIRCGFLVVIAARFPLITSNTLQVKKELETLLGELNMLQ